MIKQTTRSIQGVLSAAVVLSCGAHNAWPATLTIGASKDNSIYQNFADHSAGGSAGIFAGTTAMRSPRRGLIAFDVAGSVPAGATITAAQLTLYLGKAGGGSNQTIELHRLTADWGEGAAGSLNPVITNSGMGFAANPGDATWNARFFGSTPWSNPGANGDFNPAASASAVVAPTVVPPALSTWLSTAALVSDVQSWLDNPATNFGWILINADETSPGTASVFYSRTADTNAVGDPLDPNARPALAITFTIVPEPAAGVLFLMAGTQAYAVRRRRQSPQRCR